MGNRISKAKYVPHTDYRNRIIITLDDYVSPSYMDRDSYDTIQIVWCQRETIIFYTKHNCSAGSRRVRKWNGIDLIKALRFVRKIIEE